MTRRQGRREITIVSGKVRASQAIQWAVVAMQALLAWQRWSRGELDWLFWGHLAVAVLGPFAIALGARSQGLRIGQRGVRWRDRRMRRYVVPLEMVAALREDNDRTVVWLETTDRRRLPTPLRAEDVPAAAQALYERGVTV